MEIKDMIAKGAQAKSAQELKELAAKEDWQMSDEEAASYFEELKELTSEKKTGELNDDELDNVSGGGCYKDNRLVVTTFNWCDEFVCKCGGRGRILNELNESDSGTCKRCKKRVKCSHCKYCSYEKGLWLCNNPSKRK